MPYKGYRFLRSGCNAATAKLTLLCGEGAVVLSHGSDIIARW